MLECVPTACQQRACSQAEFMCHWPCLHHPAPHRTHRHTDTRTDRQAGVENKCWVSPCKHSRSKSASATTRTKPATAATTKPTAATACAKAAHSGVILIGPFGLLSRRARVCVLCVSV